MNIAYYLEKQYDPVQPCWELVSDVLESEVGKVEVGYRTLNRSVREMAKTFRLAIHKSPHGYEQVENPEDFTIVLMGRTKLLGVHHCGIWYAGKVLHAMPNLTAHEDLSVVMSRYDLVEFWAKK